MNIDASSSVFGQSLTKHRQKDQPQKDFSTSFLSDLSLQDKPWDIHKAQSVKVSDILDLGYEKHQKQAARMRECAKILEFGWYIDGKTGRLVLNLKNAYFCRVRHCPICQWRRALMWVARFYQAFPKIYADHPEWRYIMVTLTVRNCPVLELKSTIAEMNAAWKRLSERKSFPGLGFIRTLEITRGGWVMKKTGADIPAKRVASIPLADRTLKDKSIAHPHYHCLIAVDPSYFAGRNYLSTAKWSKLWQEALRIDYEPICDVRIVKPKDYSKNLGTTIWRDNTAQEKQELALDEIRNSVIAIADEIESEPIQPTNYEFIFLAIKEIIKYAVKPDDILLDTDWLLELSTQLKNSRAVAVGGEFRKYLKEGDEERNQDLICDKESLQENEGGLFFGWREQLSRYQGSNQVSKLS